MKNKKLYEKLEKNFHQEIQTELEFLREKGHILVRINEGLQVWRYNARINDFQPTLTIKECIDYLTTQCPNYFDIFMTIDDYVSIIVDVLPIVSVNEIDEFREYTIAINEIKDEKVLKEDLKKLEKELKNHQRPVLTNEKNNIQEHIQAMTNDGIVLCRYSDGQLLKKAGLFKFDKKGQKWEKITDTYISNLLNKVFSTDFTPETLRWKYKQYYDGVIENNLPYQWNKQKEYQEQIKNFNNPKIDGSQWV